MSQVLEIALQHAKNWIEGLDERSVAATADVDTLKSRFSLSLPVEGCAPQHVIDELVEKTIDGHTGSAGGRFFAWVIGGALESALAADWLVSSWDQNAVLSACGPAASAVEEIAGIWIKQLLDLPIDSSFAFTTGCQSAHTTCLAAARHELLKCEDWDVEDRGLFGAPRIVILTSTLKHASIERAARLIGLGRSSLHLLDTNEVGQITKAGLADALNRVEGPAILSLSAGDINTGVCDPFEELIPLAKEAGVWVHIDGAFGLFARASKAKRYLVEGVEKADSWAVDGHKWLNVPFDCGIAIIRNREAHKASMTQAAPYIQSNEGARDQIDWTPEWSRRARGVPVYAALRELGRNGVESLVDRCCAYCATLVEEIGKLPGAEILARPILNQGLIRFCRPGVGAKENDAFTDRVIDDINASGEAFFGGTTWQGQRAMRISVVNWRTTDTDVTRSIEATSLILRAALNSKT